MKKIILILTLTIFTSLFTSSTIYAETADEYFEQGNQFYSENKYEQAIEAYNKAIELNSQDHRFYANRNQSVRSLMNPALFEKARRVRQFRAL